MTPALGRAGIPLIPRCGSGERRWRPSSPPTRLGWSQRLLLLVALVAIGGVSGSCVRAPGTARDQIIFHSEENDIEVGVETFRQILKVAPLVTDPQITEMVNRVGSRIAEAANKPEYHWEFAVIRDDKTINAFALPGGKVALFTGIFEKTKNEAGLATVIGHEVAHALQRHGAERQSRAILEGIGQLGVLAGAASGAVNPGAALGILSAYGVGVSLPFGRNQESEADLIGLRLMAKAGYDPREALNFWERMSGCPRKMIGKLCFRSGQAIPEFLSTHPSDETRIRNLEVWVHDALRYYQGDAVAPEAPPATPRRPTIGPPPRPH